MEFRVLGTLEVLGGERRLALGGTKQRSVLAILLLEANRVVSIDRLVDDLWGDAPPAGPEATLQVYISKLRKLLEPERSSGGEHQVLVSRRPGYVIEVPPESLDLLRFDAMVAEGRRRLAAGDAAVASAQLGAALALWRGPALADLVYERFAQRALPRLEEERLTALEDRIEADLALGRHRQLVGELEALVAEYPVRERLRAQLLLALYRSGRQTDALKAYRDARSFLAEELGLDPGRELQRLEQAILVQDPALDLASGEPIRASERATNQAPVSLPLPLTSFVGREAERAQLGGLLASTPLVSIIGPGGAGKTRLALQVAWDSVSQFPDGIYLVELAGLTEPALVPQAVAGALGLPPDDQRGALPSAEDPFLPALREHVRGRRMLIVLDNCEHVLAAAATLVERLLQSSSELRILATSREVLDVPGEVPRPLGSLSLPDAAVSDPAALAASEAVQLFCERASSSFPGFVLDAATAPAVREICRRLDGLPLALELAAARLRALPPQQLAEALNERFGLLMAGSRTAPARHQTLRATIAWSYDLLSEQERAALRSLSTFAGRWSLEAATAVTGLEDDVLAVLCALVDKSLVVVDQRQPETKYRLLETIRHYAREKLDEAGEGDEARRRHALWFLERAERAEAALGSRDRRRWVTGLDDDQDDFRAALRWLVDGREAVLALRLAAALGPLWLRLGVLVEGRASIEKALALRPAPPPASAKALAAAAVLASEQGDYAGAQALAEEARSVFDGLGSRRGAASCLCLLAGIQRARGDGAGTDMSRAVALADEALAVFRELDDRAGVAAACRELGVLARTEGDHDRARHFLQEGLRYFDVVEEENAVGDPAGAPVHARQRSQVLTDLAALADLEGDHLGATTLLEESLGLSQGFGNRLGTAQCLEGLAAVAAHQGQGERAAVLLGAAEVIREEIGAALTPRERREQERLLDELRGELGRAFGPARSRGRSMTPAQAAAFVREGLAARS